MGMLKYRNGFIFDWEIEKVIAGIKEKLNFSEKKLIKWIYLEKSCYSFHGCVYITDI